MIFLLFFRTSTILISNENYKHFKSIDRLNQKKFKLIQKSSHLFTEFDKQKMISRWISWMANQTSNENESNDNDDDDDEVELNDIDNQIPTSGMIVIINIHTSG